MQMRHLKVITCLVAVICLIQPAFAFAQVDSNIYQDIVNRLDPVICLLSRVWVIPAAIAGKLMTNTFVYGTFIGLDVYLWKLWVVFRNFANFALGFIFVGGIFKHLFK